MAHRTMGRGIYDLTADEYVRFRIKEACRRVGCQARTTVYWRQLDESIRHGDDEYYICLTGLYASPWDGIVGWLDTLHAPLIEQQQPSYPDASMS